MLCSLPVPVVNVKRDRCHCRFAIFLAEILELDLCFLLVVASRIDRPELVELDLPLRNNFGNFHFVAGFFDEQKRVRVN